MTEAGVAPCHDASVSQNCRQRTTCGIDPLDILSTDLEQQYCHHLPSDAPRSLQFHLPELQRKLKLWNKSFAGSSADLEQQRGHHRSLDLPMSPHVHLELEWKQSLSHELAACSWENLWLQRCHHHSLDPTSICQNCSLVPVPELIFNDSFAVAPKLWMAPGDNPVSSNTPQSKGAPRCSYLWLLCNNSVVAIFQAGNFKRLAWIQKVPIRRSKSYRNLCPKDRCARRFWFSNRVAFRYRNDFTSSARQRHLKFQFGSCLLMVTVDMDPSFFTLRLHSSKMQWLGKGIGDECLIW